VHPEFSHKAFFLCEPSGTDPAAEVHVSRAGGDHETSGAGFFTRSELPPLSLARVVPEEIELAFAHHADPSLPTEFD
jgi:hypothetical protein